MTEFAKALGDTGKSMSKIIFILAIITVASIAIAYMTEKPLHDYNKVINQNDMKDDEANLLWISGTEYTSKDSNGSTIVKLRDSKNNFIDTNCSETILYPNRTIYMDWTPMYQDLVYGEYFLNFEIPETTGVYSQEVSCLIKNKNVSSAKAFHISALGDRILTSTNSLNGTLGIILQTLNCSNPTINRTCELISQINGSQTTNFYNTNQSLNEITNIVTSINETVSGLGKVYYEVSSPDCAIGSQWIVTLNASNEEGESLKYLDCTLDSTRFGTELMPYSNTFKSYQTIHDCDNPEEEVNWSISCVKQ